jgi:transcriptional accessory protein Tex/SPT6
MSEQEMIQDAAAEAAVEEAAVVEAAVVEADVVAATPAVVETAAERSAEGASAEAAADAGDDASAGSRVVRTLAVGQPVPGTIKRLTEFGAFVDIGVGRDGLVHISELSVNRVAKVTDVLAEGQQVTMWIKKLDREKNRISLTMIEPGKRTIRDLQKDEVVEGVVTRILPYGAFIDIGVGREALLHVREMGEQFVAKPEDVVKVGGTVQVRIIEVARRRNRIDLSMKGLREEPEPEVVAAPETPAQSAAAVPAAPEPATVDTFADMEVLSPIQLAFRRAQEKSGVDLGLRKEGKSARQTKAEARAAQEEIISRTLANKPK